MILVSVKNIFLKIKGKEKIVEVIPVIQAIVIKMIVATTAAATIITKIIIAMKAHLKVF